MKIANLAELESPLKRHLKDVLSIIIETRPWEGESKAPVYLREAYAFLTSSVLGQSVLFMLDRGAQILTPATIKKHISEVNKRWSGDIVYVTTGIDSSRRKQLITQRVPFVVPGNQVFLPTLGVDLREHFRSARVSAETFGPATQAVLLHTLHHGETESFSPQELAEALGYSRMTLTRAFDQLESAGLGHHYTAGKRRFMELKESRRELWEKALPLLRSPVTQRVRIDGAAEKLDAPSAGLSGLSGYTNLSAPGIPVVAIALSDWKSLKDKFSVVEDENVSTVEVELWSYPPKVVEAGPLVDRLSLYLSLRGSDDERVEAELENLMEGMRW